MKFSSLKIGNLISQLPIIQGGMGIGVSASKLASAVANAGGIGIISSAQLGYKDPIFNKDALTANLNALKEHITIAKNNAPNGIIGVNIMVASSNYAEYVKTAINSGIDLIISGAGLPTMLPKIAKDSKVKLAPIVSSLKSAKVILKLWDRHDNIAPDLVIIEGPKAGGHLGFKEEDLENDNFNFDNTIVQIIEETKKYSEKYNKDIPVIVAGGIYDGYDIAKYLKLGANGVQMATRFVTTYECDASQEFKDAYINCSNDDISIVKSPVGMPGRAIENDFIKKTKLGREKITKCYNCLTPCDPKVTPYCISKALMNAVNGNINDGLIFCGENASRIDKMMSVKELMDELERDLRKA